MGTRLSGGLTGEHSYCGSPVLSKKSFFVSLSAIVAGMIISTLRDNFPFLEPSVDYVPSGTYQSFDHYLTLLVFLILAIYGTYHIVFPFFT